MRARNIKPGFFQNDLLVEVSFAARLLFIGLWTLCDREGRMEDRPRKIKMQLFPADDIDIEAKLEDLQDKGFIVRYEHGEGQYIQVQNFTKHQNPHVKESASTIPAPDEHGASTVQAPDEHETSPADSPSLNPDSGSLTAEEESDVAEAPQTPPYEPEHYELAVHLDQRIQEHNPKARPASRKQLESWSNDARLMVDRDEHGLDEIRTVIDWCQESEFWRSNVMSMGKLREKFPTLWAQMHEKRSGQRSPPRNVPDYSGIDQFDAELAAMERGGGR